MMHNGSVSVKFYVEHTYTNSPFFTNNQFVELVAKPLFPRELQREFVLEEMLQLFLDEVIFDVIGVSLKSENLAPPIVLLKK